MLEKKFRAISPQLVTVDGDSSGRIGLDDSCLFKVEQEVILKADGEQNLKVVVIDIPDKNILVLGYKDNTSRNNRIDVSNYTVAKNSTIESSLQNRPVVTLQDVERWTYEESPIVAIRTHLVDICGNSYKDNNPLPVSIINSENKSENCHIYRINYPSANVELSQILPDNTKKLYVTSSDLKAKMKVSFSSGGTSNNDYIVIHMGNNYCREDLNLVNKTLYFQTNMNNIVIEIEVWT